MERVPRPGTAVHLQEFLHREQMNGSPAAGTPPCAHEPRAIRWTRLGFKEECPRWRECSDQAAQTNRQDIFPKERPNVRKKGKVSERFPRPVRRPVPAGSGRYSGFFFHRRFLRPAGFRRTPLWYQGVIWSDHGVQRRRFSTRISHEMREEKTRKKGITDAQNPYRRGLCTQKKLCDCIRPKFSPCSCLSSGKTLFGNFS